jgi:hypothetical protein
MLSRNVARVLKRKNASEFCDPEALDGTEPRIQATNSHRQAGYADGDEKAPSVSLGVEGFRHRRQKGRVFLSACLPARLKAIAAGAGCRSRNLRDSQILRPMTDEAGRTSSVHLDPHRPGSDKQWSAPAVEVWFRPRLPALMLPHTPYWP